MTTLASLVVSLGFDVAGFRRDVSSAEGGLDDLGGAADRAESRFAGLATGMKAAAAAGGIAAGAALAQGFAATLDIESGRAKLSAQLNLSKEDAALAGQIAGDVYAGGWGENLDQVNEAVRGVVSNMNVEMGSVDMEPLVTQATVLSDVFGIDVADSTQAAGQMMRNLGTDGQTAMDLITRVTQTGGLRAEDLLDTLTEYSPMFAQVGLSGEQSMGILNQGLAAGARNTDLVADAMKEFGIRARDGSTTTAEGFSALGLSAQDMAGKIAAGGPTAAAALDLTLDRLRAIEDPVTRDAAAVALFGTQAEDLGAALYALDPSEAVASLGNFTGATMTAGNTASDTAQGRILPLQRGFEQFLQSLVSMPGPMGTFTAGLMTFGPGALAAAGSLAMITMAFGPLLVRMVGLGVQFALTTVRFGILFAQLGVTFAVGVARIVATLVVWSVQQAVHAARVLASMTATGIRYVAAWVLMAAGASGNAVRMAAAWLLTTGVAAATAVASMVATAARMVAQWVLMAAGAMVRAAIMAAAWLVAMGPVGWVTAAIIGLVALIIANWDKVVAWTKKAWTDANAAVDAAVEWIKKAVATGVQWVLDRVAWFGRLPDMFATWFGQAKDWAVRKLDELLGWLHQLPGQVGSIFAGAGEWLVNAGRSLIQGFWNGIKAMGNWLYGQLMGWIRSVVPGPILQFLGIHSPSTWGEKVVGEMIPAGIGAGIIGNARAATDAAYALASHTADAAMVDVPAPRLSAAGLSGMAGARGVDARAAIDAAERVVANVVINNPRAERASDSFAREMRDLSVMGTFPGSRR